MLSPSSIARDPHKPFQTTRLPNGTLVIDDAHEGQIALTGGAKISVKGIKPGSSAPCAHAS